MQTRRSEYRQAQVWQLGVSCTSDTERTEGYRFIVHTQDVSLQNKVKYLSQKKCWPRHPQIKKYENRQGEKVGEDRQPDKYVALQL